MTPQWSKYNNHIIPQCPSSTPVFTSYTTAVAHLRQGGAELALQRVAVVDDVLKVLLGQAEALLRLPQRVQQPVPLVQHVDHQLLKVGVRVRGAALRAALAQRGVLADGGHHLAHHPGAARRGERFKMKSW